MLRAIPLRLWISIHRWTSLVCTLFLLVLCITGLPLIFQAEIDAWLQPQRYAALPGAQPVNMDHLVELAREAYPGQIITSIGLDQTVPRVRISMAPSWSALSVHGAVGHFIRFDTRTAQIVEESKPPSERSLSFTGVLLRLHMDLFTLLPGEMFLAAMALLFLIAIVSGVVLYAPFSRKAGFGVIRARQSVRLKWLDLHNLLGIVTVAWALVVGATGVMNELSSPLFDLWEQNDLSAALRPWHGKAALSQEHLASVQKAINTAKEALPGVAVTGIVFPGSPFGGSPYHYLLWTRGNTPLTSQLFNPVLIDAQTGELATIVRMPWYLRALEVSRPLHFGNYGGLPLKIIWTLLDLVTIAVLGSGLYLWFSRRKSSIEARIAELELVEAASEPSTARVVAE